jgi:hypothetical protein
MKHDQSSISSWPSARPSTPMAPDRGRMRWRWLALAAAGAPWSFAVERSKAVQVRPEGHPGHEPRSKDEQREGRRWDFYVICSWGHS